MRRAAGERGITLLELMIVLAIMAGATWAFAAFVSSAKSDLKSDASRLAAALRSAFDRAAATSVHHRAVIDLDEESYRVERCEGKVKLRRAAREEDEEEGKAKDDEARAASAPPTPDEAALEAGARLGGGGGEKGASCQPAIGELGRGASFHRRHGIEIEKVHVGHLEEPAASGKATINFFPLGRAERAVVEVANRDGDRFAIVVHPLSGRVEVKSGDDWKRAEEFVNEDAEGNEVAK